MHICFELGLCVSGRRYSARVVGLMIHSMRLLAVPLGRDALEATFPPQEVAHDPLVVHAS